MRSTLLLPCVLFCSLTPAAGQQPLPVGPYGPADATSVVHIDLKAVRASLLGKAIEQSRIGKAAAKFFGLMAGYEWTEIESLRLASVARPEMTAMREVWVLHARGKKGLSMPTRLEVLGVDALASKDTATGKIGFVCPVPGELVVGETAFLRRRLAGTKLGASSPAQDNNAPYLLRAILRVPRVGVAQIGKWSLPLLDGVSYHKDPLKKITVVLDRNPRSGVLQLRAEFEFAGRVSAYPLAETLREKVARALRDRAYFNFWIALQTLRIKVKVRNNNSYDLELALDLKDRRTIDAALAGYAPLGSLIDIITNQVDGLTNLAEEEKTLQMEEQVREEDEKLELDEKKQNTKKVDDRKGKKKR